MPDTLNSSLSNFQPPDFVRTPGGGVIVTNGLDRGLLWDGVDSAAVELGIDAPTTAPTVNTDAAAGGAAAGTYYCYIRYKDADGNYSSLSPVTEVSTSASDGFDWDTIQKSTQTRVTHIELLRSVQGTPGTVYLITTLANSGTPTYTTDDDDDDTISANTSLVLTNSDGTTNANRFTPPPTKPFTLAKFDRTFYCGDVVYTRGHAHVTNGSDTVTIYGGTVTDQMDGRLFYVQGDSVYYTIDSVDTGNNQLTLDSNYAGTTDLFALYAVRATDSERNAVYYSRALEPESVPATSNVRIAEADDEITGMFSLRNYAFVTMRRSLYHLEIGALQGRNTDNNLPGVGVQWEANRGCVNHRCAAVVEGQAYLLDQQGVWLFTGAGSEPISQAIQDFWRDEKIAWEHARRFFHSYNPQEEVIRWHVSLGGDYYPRHALCFQIRRGEWWVEKYHRRFGASCQALVGDRWRTLFGSMHAKHFLQEGTLDGYTGQTLREEATAAGVVSLSDSTNAPFVSAMVGAPLCIVEGRGKGQVREIVAVPSASKVTLDRPWTVLPDATSKYQVGGVAWNCRTGTFDYIRLTTENLAQIDLAVQPTTYESTLDVRRYEDHADQPVQYELQGDVGDGVRFEKDGRDAILDLKREQSRGTFSGYRFLRIPGHTHDMSGTRRFLSVELRGVQGVEPTVIHEINVMGVEN